jgi:hypothetical protein
MNLPFLESCFAEADFIGSMTVWHDLASAISNRAASTNLSQEQQEIVAAELLLASLLVVPQENNVDFYFTSPQQLWVAPGQAISPPPILKIHIKHWRKRATEETNPFLRARYADAVWDLERFASQPVQRDQSWARIAIDSYLLAYKASLNRNPVRALALLLRALALSTEIKELDLIEVASAHALALLHELPEDGYSGIWLEAAKFLYANKILKKLTLAPLKIAFKNRFFAAIEKKDKLTADLGIDLHLRLFADSPSEKKNALLAYAQMHSAIATSEPALVAVSSLLYVVHRLEEAGLLAMAEELRFQAENLSPAVEAGMHEKSYTQTVETAKIDTFFEKLIDIDDVCIAMYRVAKHTLPDVQKVRLGLIQAVQKFPIQYLVTRVSYGPSGLPIVETNGSLGETDQHFSGYYTDYLNFNSLQFKWGWDRFLAKFSPSQDSICEWLAGSFLILKDRMPFIEEGVRAHLAGDYIKSIHLFVPQIEEMLRQLLKLLSIPRSKSVRGKPGVTELKNMGEILRDPRIIETLDEDVHIFLLHLLVNKPGFNLRNDLSHGIAPATVFGELSSGLVLQCVILLGAIRDEALVLTPDPEEQD